MYYAEYCPWGTNISYESMGGDAYRFFTFEDKTDRDNFVNEHYWDENTYAGCWASVSRKTVERQCGKISYWSLPMALGTQTKLTLTSKSAYLLAEPIYPLAELIIADDAQRAAKKECWT